MDECQRNYSDKRKVGDIIGTVSRDLHAGERRYAAKYPLDHPLGIRRALVDQSRLTDLAYVYSDYDALNVLLDLRQAMGAAQLTGKQTQAIALVYAQGRTQDEAAAALGLASRGGVNNLLKRACERIAAVNGWGGEVAWSEWAAAEFGEWRENTEGAGR